MGAQNQSARTIETQLETLLFARYLPKQHLQFSFLMCFCQMFSHPIDTQPETLLFARYLPKQHLQLSFLMGFCQMFLQWSFNSLNVVLMSKIRFSSKINWTGWLTFSLFYLLDWKLFVSQVLRAQVNPIRIGRAICPGLSMLLYFHRENEINKVFSQVFFKLLVKLFWKQLFFRAPFRGAFICDGAFLWI